MRWLFVGDVVADEGVDRLAATRALAGIAGLDLPASDRRFVGNLEVPLCEDNTGQIPAKGVSWHAREGVAKLLEEIGFAGLSLANNHIADRGIEGMLRTREVLSEAGIGVFGAGEDLAASVSPWRPYGGGLSVFGLTCTLPPNTAADVGRAGVLGVRVATRYDVDTWRLEELPGTAPRIGGHFDADVLQPLLWAMEQEVRSGQAVAVHVHWGVAWSARVLDYQFELAERLVDAGAGLILGHHSHTLGPVGNRNGSLVCFGLGDFIRSPGLVALGDRQRPGLARDWEIWSKTGLAVSVTIDGGRFRDFAVHVVEIERASGLPTTASSPAHAAALAWVRWAGMPDVAVRDGWRVWPTRDSVRPEVVPLGYSDLD